MALAGVAAAETTLVWDMDFASSGVVLNTADGVTTNLGSNVGQDLISNGAITLNNDPFSFSQTAGNVSYAEEFSLVATVSLGKNQPGSWPAIFGFGEDNNWCWKACYYVETSANIFSLDKDGWNTVDETYKNSGNISYTFPETDGAYGDQVTVVVQNDGKGTLTMYVDEQMVGYTTITKESDYGTDKLVKNFTFGARNGGGNKSNITLYDAQLLKGLVVNPAAPAVPEPTTATLSLLALAGLAARRRRK